MEEKRKRKRKERKGKGREKEKKKRKEERKEMRGKQKRGEKKNSCMGKGKKREKGERRAGYALSSSRCSHGRKSRSRELKLVYSPRATSRFQKHKEVVFSPTLIPPNLRVVNGYVVQPQT